MVRLDERLITVILRTTHDTYPALFLCALTTSRTLYIRVTADELDAVYHPPKLFSFSRLAKGRLQSLPMGHIAIIGVVNGTHTYHIQSERWQGYREV